MDRTANTPPSGGFAELKAPRIVLGAPAEFIYDGAAPVAHRMRFGSNWVGLNTFGETIKVSIKREGTEENLGNATGGSRGKVWKMPGWTAELTVQHDRALPFLDLGDIVTMWVLSAYDGNDAEIPEKLRFYVSAKGSDEGDTETAQYKLTLRHEEGLMTQTSFTLVRAKVDEYGRVIEFSTGIALAGAAAAPGSALPAEV